MGFNFKYWCKTDPYQKGIVRRYLGELWQSMVDDNLNNVPTDTEGTSWKHVDLQDLTDRTMLALFS